MSCQLEDMCLKPAWLVQATGLSLAYHTKHAAAAQLRAQSLAVVSRPLCTYCAVGKGCIVVQTQTMRPDTMLSKHNILAVVLQHATRLQSLVIE